MSDKHNPYPTGSIYASDMVPLATIKMPRFHCPKHGGIGQNVWSVWAAHRAFGPFCLDCVGEKLVEIVGVAEKVE